MASKYLTEWILQDMAKILPLKRSDLLLPIAGTRLFILGQWLSMPS